MRNAPVDNSITRPERVPVFSPDSKVLRIAVLVIWTLIVAFMVIHRNDISLDTILAYSQENTLLIVVAILALFALKGVAMLIYSGMLFAASGILLPLPLAIGVNIVGSAVMVTVPYYLTRFIGGDMAEKIAERYPKVSSLMQKRGDSDLFFTLVLRIINLIPVEALGIYLSAAGVRYTPYIIGSVLGFLPSAVLFPIMGTNIENVHSPEFLIALALQLGFMTLSFVALKIYQRRRPQTA